MIQGTSATISRSTIDTREIVRFGRKFGRIDNGAIPAGRRMWGWTAHTTLAAAQREYAAKATHRPQGDVQITEVTGVEVENIDIHTQVDVAQRRFFILTVAI